MKKIILLIGISAIFLLSAMFICLSAYSAVKPNEKEIELLSEAPANQHGASMQVYGIKNFDPKKYYNEYELLGPGLGILLYCDIKIYNPDKNGYIINYSELNKELNEIHGNYTVGKRLVDFKKVKVCRVNIDCPHAIDDRTIKQLKKGAKLLSKHQFKRKDNSTYTVYYYGHPDWCLTNHPENIEEALKYYYNRLIVNKTGLSVEYSDLEYFSAKFQDRDSQFKARSAVLKKFNTDNRPTYELFWACSEVSLIIISPD